MVEAPVQEGIERVLAGVTAWAMPTVVSEGDGLGERDVQAERSCDAGSDLGHLERMGQSGPLVVVGEDEDLGLASKSAKGGGMEDPVTVPLEAGSPLVGFLWDCPLASA